jgi:RNA polymerase sigma-70 factor (ECF subfamily)
VFWLVADDVSSILQRIADGDRSAVAACLDEYGSLVWSLAMRYLGSHADAEDATQDIFLSVWASAHRFDPSKGSEPSFVATVAHRRLIDLKRSARVRRSAPLDRLPEPASRATGHENWGSDVEVASKAMQDLPDDERHALQLAIRYGLSHAQIAEVTEQPIGTIKSRLRQNMQRLRDKAGLVHSAAAGEGSGA